MEQHDPATEECQGCDPHSALGSTQLYLQSQEPAGTHPAGRAGTALPMQTWRLKIPGVAWLLGL